MTRSVEEYLTALPPGQLRAEEYYRQIEPVRVENAVQTIGTRLSGDVEAARKAVLARLIEGVEAGEIDQEMAEIAKEEFGLRGLS
jgi:hypothetical protein